MRKARSRKDRKRYFNAPLHVKKDFVKAHLSKELREKLNKRSARVKKGYKVKILRGAHKGKEGIVLRVSHVFSKVYVEGIAHPNARGEEKPVGLSPSNLMITAMEA